jgi:hypothetical protein
MIYNIEIEPVKFDKWIKTASEEELSRYLNRLDWLADFVNANPKGFTDSQRLEFKGRKELVWSRLSELAFT